MQKFKKVFFYEYPFIIISLSKVRVGEKVVQGLNTYQYTFMENELDNGAVNPENKCFCRKGVCLKSGLIDVTDCYYGKIYHIQYIFGSCITR